jgi:hypothetical protein
MLSSMQLLAHHINELLKFMDPNHYEDAMKLRTTVENKYPFARAPVTVTRVAGPCMSQVTLVT